MKNNPSSKFVIRPKVSVAMITYNHERFIVEAIESVLMQETDFSFEIVIGEDCSTDRTREILQYYFTSFPDKIRLLLHPENLGYRMNFCLTIQACEGKYIALLEGDDRWGDSKKLQTQADFLDSNPDFIVSHHDSKVIDSDGCILADSKLQDDSKVDLSAEELIKTPALLTPTVCFRNVLGNLPPEFLKVFNTDTFLFSLLGLYGNSKYLGHQISPGYYRVHPGGVWSSLTECQARIRSANTFFWLSRFYWSLGKRKAAEYYMYKFQARLLNLFKILIRGYRPSKDSRTFRKIIPDRETIPSFLYSIYFLLVLTNHIQAYIFGWLQKSIRKFSK